MKHSHALAQTVAGHAAHFQSLLAEPGRVQIAVLRSILQQNQASAFGQQHRFASLLQADDASLAARYASQVSVARYEDLQADIERIAAGEQQVLTEAAVIAFEETGGSSGGHKQIPYTLPGLAAFQQGLLPWLDDLFQAFPQLAGGRLYWAISPACRIPKTTAGGIPIGLPGDAAYFGPEVGMAVANALAVSAEVGQIRDLNEWRWHTLLQLLRCDDLTLISVWSPSFLSELLRHASLLGSALAQAIATADSGQENQARAQLVAEVLAQAQPDYVRLWPQLQVISCWDQATSAPMAAWLRSQFPGVHLQGKGLLATEGMISLPLCDHGLPVLALESGFFEFLDREGQVWLADQVQVGQQYQILMTTHSGLYRYAIGDWVRIGGLAQRTPMLEFIGRDQTSSDLCGEKLNDAFVAERIAKLGRRFAMLVPSESMQPGQAARYLLWLDQAETGPESAIASELAQPLPQQLAQQMDEALHDNPQYAWARQLGQLAPVAAHCSEQPLARWLQWRLAQGQRLGDIKLPALLGHATAQSWRSWMASSAPPHHKPHSP
jgi:GH3 auxin-responsive promoter